MIFNVQGDGSMSMQEFVYCWNGWIKKIVKPRSALVVVDVQNDFISGSLSISNCPAGHNGEEVWLLLVNYDPHFLEIKKKSRKNIIVF